MATATVVPGYFSFSTIFCFQHCTNGSNVSCFKIPLECPCCRESLKSANFLVPPFAVPSPFCNIGDESVNNRAPPCSLLIKPTTGSFLTSYKAGDDLHVGISDSKGNTYSYDEYGVKMEKLPWKYCLAVQVVDLAVASLDNVWNASLVKHARESKWTMECYNEESHNCFSFVLEFLNSLLHKCFEKEEFCSRYILPLTSKAAGYITVYREILGSGFYVHHD